MKRHPLDPFSLVLGATFALLGLVFLFSRVDVAGLHLDWIWPLPLIALGLLIIALAVRPVRSGEQADRRPSSARGDGHHDHAGGQDGSAVAELEPPGPAES